MPRSEIKGPLYPMSRLVSFSRPSTVAEAAYEPIGFDIMEQVKAHLKAFHIANAKNLETEAVKRRKEKTGSTMGGLISVGFEREYKWQNPRLASFALMMARTSQKDQAYDLMMILDRSAAEVRHNSNLRVKLEKMHITREYYLDPYFDSANFLEAAFFNSELPEQYMMGKFSQDYMHDLAKLWHRTFHFKYKSLLFPDFEKLKQRFPEIPNIDWRDLTLMEKMDLHELRVFREKMRKIKKTEPKPMFRSRVFLNPHPVNIPKITL